MSDQPGHRTWYARIGCQWHDTGAVTAAGARDWLRAMEMQLERRGLPEAVRIRADEEV